MKRDKIIKMEDIDQRAQLGLYVTELEKKFFNDNYLSMVEHIQDDLTHWKHHAKTFDEA